MLGRLLSIVCVFNTSAYKLGVGWCLQLFTAIRLLKYIFIVIRRLQAAFLTALCMVMTLALNTSASFRELYSVLTGSGFPGKCSTHAYPTFTSSAAWRKL